MLFYSLAPGLYSTSTILAVNSLFARNHNGDGVVDFDNLEFLNLYDAVDPRIDFNHDGVNDFGNYLEFLNLLDAGC